LTALGREIAQANGLYESRREIQLIFVILFALFCFSSLVVVLSWWLRDCWRWYLIPLLGVALLVSFVVIRVASFQHVNYLISKWRIIGPFRMKYIGELGGILIVGLGAVQSLHRTHKAGQAPGKSATPFHIRENLTG
jgi:O-antigen/teichoic acid export membrane protein